MAVDVSTVEIRAIDQASQVFRQVQGSAEKLHASYTKLAGMATAAFAFAGLVALVKNAIDAADEINKLSQKTGIAVGELSKLKYVADLSGVSTEALGKGIKKLSENMVLASDASSKSARVFKALGVDLKGGPTAVLEQLADVFSQLQDGEVKTTLATQIFGKAGADLIPMLNQGRGGIQKLKDEAVRLGLVLDEDTAKAAEQFNDNLRAVKASSEGLGIRLLNELAPSLLRVSGAMKVAAEDGGVLKAVLVGIGGAMSEMLGLNEESAVKMRKRMNEITLEMARLTSEIQSGANAGKLVMDELAKQREARLTALREEFRLIQLIMTAEAGGFSDQSDRRRQQGRVLSGNNAGLEARARGALASGDAVQTPGLSLLVGLQEEYAKLNNVTKQNETLEKTLLELKKDGNAKVTAAMRAQIVEQAKKNDLLKKQLETEKFLDEQHQLDLAHTKERGDAVAALANDWQDATEQLQIEADLIGLCNIDRQKAVLLEKARLDIIAAGDNAGAIRDINQNLQAQIALLERIDATQKQLNIWDDLATRAGDFFSNLAVNGKSAFDDLKSGLKSFLKELIALFAKKWILNLAANATGGAAGNALSLASSAAGNGSLVGAGASALTGAYSSFSGGFALGSAEAAGTLSTSSMLVTGTTGLAEGAGAWMATLGATGWGLIIVAAVAVLASVFGKGGGPKVGGYAGSSFDANGNPMGSASAPGTDNGRFFTPSQLDPELKKITDGFGKSFGAALRALGGTSSGFSFLLGADHDPNGSAQSRVSAGVLDSQGNYVYKNVDQSMDDKEVGAALSLEAQRALLAALQHSDLPPAIAGILNGIVAESASLEDIQGVLTAAAQMKQILDGLATMNVKGLDIESLKAFQREGEAIGDTFARLANKWAYFNDNFFTDAEKLERSQKKLNDTFTDLNQAVPANIVEFRKLVEGCDLSTEAGRKMWETLMDIAPTFLDVRNGLDGVGDSAKDAAVKLDAAARAQELYWAQVENARQDRERQLGEVTGAREGIANFRRGLLQDPGLTTLDPFERLASARLGYEDILRKAQGGDVSAAGQLGGAAETYLKIARELFASGSQYVEIFNAVTQGVDAVDARLSLQEQNLKILTGHTDIMNSQLATLAEIRALAAQIRDATERNGVEVKEAVADAVAANDRR